jgi:hypothetical protein
MGRMFVRWKKRRRPVRGTTEGAARPDLWHAQLVVSTRDAWAFPHPTGPRRRATSAPRQIVLATLGSCCPDEQDADRPTFRLRFWRQADRRLAAFKLTSDELAPILAKLAAVVPRPGPEEVAAIPPDVRQRIDYWTQTKAPPVDLKQAARKIVAELPAKRRRIARMRRRREEQATSGTTRTVPTAGEPSG